MSASDDTDDVLHRLFTDEHDDQLLAGRADADGGQAGVAVLMAALREPGRAHELAGHEQLLAQMSQAVSDTVAVAPSGKPVVARLITTKVAAIAALTLFSAGAAAAATGTLPDAVQRGVADTVSHVGIRLDHPVDRETASTTTIALVVPVVTTVEVDGTDDTVVPDATVVQTDSTIQPNNETVAAAETVPVPTPITVPVGPTATGPAMTGLCTAYRASGDQGGRLDSVAMQNLVRAAAAAKQSVDEYCATATETTDPASDNGGPLVQVEPGNSGLTPAVTVPARPADPAQPADVGIPGVDPAVTAPSVPVGVAQPVVHLP